MEFDKNKHKIVTQGNASAIRCKECNKYYDKCSCDGYTETFSCRFLEKCIVEMCSRIGKTLADLEVCFETGEHWNNHFSWTQSQANEFKAWMAEALKERPMFKAIADPRAINTASARDRLADEFITMYGWKIEEVKND